MASQQFESVRKCPTCSRRYRISPAKAGKRILCRECNNPLDPPDFLRRPVQQPLHQREQTTAPRSNQNQRGLRSLVCLALGAFLTLTAVLIWLGFQVVTSRNLLNVSQSQELVAEPTESGTDQAWGAVTRSVSTRKGPAVPTATSVSGSESAAFAGESFDNPVPPPSVPVISPAPLDDPIPASVAPQPPSSEQIVPPPVQAPSALTQQQEQQPPREEPAKPDYIVERLPATIKCGEASVRITAIELGSIAVGGNALYGTSSSETVLGIGLLITNTGSQPLRYRTWSGETVTFGVRTSFASVVDDAGERYNRRYVSATSEIDPRPRPVGRTREAVLQKGQTVSEVLAFEPITRTIQHLDLLLPGGNVGSDGPTRVRIPVKMIKRR